MSEPNESTDCRHLAWQHWTVLGATLAWAACFAGSIVLPDLLTRPGSSGWEALGYFILWQMIAAGVSLVGLVLTVVLWIGDRIGPWWGVLGLFPAALTGAGLIWLALAE